MKPGDIIQKRRETKIESEMLNLGDHESELSRAKYWSLHLEIRRLTK